MSVIEGKREIWHDMDRRGTAYLTKKSTGNQIDVFELRESSTRRDRLVEKKQRFAEYLGNR